MLQIYKDILFIFLKNTNGLKVVNKGIDKAPNRAHKNYNKSKH